MKMHFCFTDDGVGVPCVCTTGLDHTEDEMDLNVSHAPIATDQCPFRLWDGSYCRQENDSSWGMCPEHSKKEGQGV